MSKNIKYFDNLIEIKNIPNKFKIYESILHFFKLYKLNIISNNFHIISYNFHIISYLFSYNFILFFIKFHTNFSTIHTNFINN